MYMFDNLVILSDFTKKIGNCLPKKPCRIYVLRLSFCTFMLHQFSQNCFPFYACKTGGFSTIWYAYCGVVCLFRIRLGIIRVLSSIRIFSSAFYPLSAFSHLRFILHPHFLIRILSPIRIFSCVFSHPPSVSAIRIRIRVLSLPPIMWLRKTFLSRHLANM